VNVGTANVAATWLRWDLWDPSISPAHCPSNTNLARAECLGHNFTWNHTVGTPNHSLWNGCVADRDQSNDVASIAPSSQATNFPANQELACPAASILPLTTNWTTVNNTINAMSPSGGTNQTIGLLWGWLSLLQQAPLNAPAEDPNYRYQ